MDGHGWNDIAYSFGITQNGDIFTGRGIGVRSGAQGTNAGNQNFYAVVFIGGGDASVSERAKYAYKWLINQLRKVKDNAGKAVKPHKYFVDTSCAGPVLTPFALSLDGKDISGLGEVSGPAYSPPAFPLPSNHWYGVDDGTPYSHSGLLSRGRDDYWVRRIQKIVGTTVDGDYGPNTAKAVKVYVDKHVASTVSLGDRTKVGPKVWKVLF
jgi:peptidoglycan hydrolase-like protein with peptidoglycan-binding domain